MLGMETQRMCLPPTLPWPVGFSVNWSKNGKKEVCGFIPAFLLCVWEHCPRGYYLPNFFGHIFPTELTIWADCKDSREELCVEKRWAVCPANKSQGKEATMTVVIFRRLLWKRMYFVLCKNKKLARDVVSWILGSISNNTGGETQEQIAKKVFLNS